MEVVLVFIIVLLWVGLQAAEDRERGKKHAP